MDWNSAIEKNREALKRILAALVAMAGLSAGPHPEVRSLSGSEGEPRRTLPRHLHRAVLRLLRPAESAARRLIIAAARGLEVTLPPPRPAKPRRVSMENTLRSLGIAVTMSPADCARAATARRAAAVRAARPRGLSLPLLDPLRASFRPRRIPVPAHAAPRIWSFDGAERRPVPLPATPDDPVDAARLALRLQALASALDDLPAQARRLARWRARSDAALAQERDRDAGRDASRVAGRDESRDAAGAQNGKAHAAGRIRRLSPLRPGRPPGWCAPGSRRRPFHEVHEILNTAHGLAFWALERPDTS